MMLSIFLLMFGVSWETPCPTPTHGENAVFFRGLREEHAKIILTATADTKKNHLELTSILKLLTHGHDRFYNADFDLDEENERGFKFKHKNAGDIIWIYKAGQKAEDGLLLLVSGRSNEGTYSEQIVVEDKSITVRSINRQFEIGSPDRLEFLYHCGDVNGWEQTE